MAQLRRFIHGSAWVMGVNLVVPSAVRTIWIHFTVSTGFEWAVLVKQFEWIERWMSVQKGNNISTNIFTKRARDCWFLGYESDKFARSKHNTEDVGLAWQRNVSIKFLLQPKTRFLVAKTKKLTILSFAACHDDGTQQVNHILRDAFSAICAFSYRFPLGGWVKLHHNRPEVKQQPPRCFFQRKWRGTRLEATHVCKASPGIFFTYFDYFHAIGG